MLARILFCAPFLASLLGAQDAPDALTRKRDLGLDLRVGLSGPLGSTMRTEDGRMLTIGAVPTFNVEGRMLEHRGISLLLTGEFLPLRRTEYSAAAKCSVVCSGYVTSASGLQAGLDVRATLAGAAYVSASVAERGSFTRQEGGCVLIGCSAWPTYGNTGLYSVKRVGIGVRPRGAGIRPIAEVNASFYRLGATPTAVIWRSALGLPSEIGPLTSDMHVRTFSANIWCGRR